MINPDQYYDNIGSRMQKMLSIESGDAFSSFNQHIGKIINHEESMFGNTYEDMLHRIERIMKGEKADHWEGQNKMTLNEKAIKEMKDGRR